MIVLSHVQITPVLRARASGALTATISPDLGISTVAVTLTPHALRFADGTALPWESADRIARSENKCYVVEHGGAHEIQVFSEHTNWLRSLMPTTGAPTMLVSGIPMHRIKATDPWKDTQTKIATVAPVVGPVLDTATGLGYTAIAAAQSAEQVTTIELDPAALEVARLNPWSQALFDNPRIHQIIGDAGDVVPTLADGAFARIIHDPPTLSLAGHLYSGGFYQQLARVLRPGGRLFHYIGDPASKSGQRTTAGVIRRLQEAGFGRIARRPEAFGVLAYR